VIGERRQIIRHCLISLVASCAGIALSALATWTLNVAAEPLGALMLLVVVITLALGTWPSFISATLAMSYAAFRVGLLVAPPPIPVSPFWPLVIASSAVIAAALRANLMQQLAATVPVARHSGTFFPRPRTVPDTPIADTPPADVPPDTPSSDAMMRHTARLALVGQMTAAMAHELRQPLAASAGFIDAALHGLERRGDDDIQDQLQHLRDARDQVMLAGQIINRMLVFLRPGEDERRIIDLHETIRQSLALVRADARMHEVMLTFEPDAQTMFALADAVQVQQVVCNLVRNAIDAVVAGNSSQRLVRIVTWRDVETGRAYVRVTDTGPGVPQLEHDRIFHPFYTTRAEGTGLGLWICRDIVQRHGGDITLLPTVTGIGAQFEFWLPLESLRDEPSDR